MSQNFKTRIEDFLTKGESVQIVAPPGFGKSRFGRSLGGTFIDPNLLQSPDEILSHLKSSPETRLFVIDSFNLLLDEGYRPIFRYLKATRDNNHGQLAIVFLVPRPLQPQLQPLLGDLYEVATEHLEYLPPLNPPQYDLFGFNPTPSQLQQITQLSGGIPSLVKICTFALRDGTSLDPKANSKLKAQLEEMLESSPTNPAYDNSHLIQEYLKSRSNSSLSASETRLIELFKSHFNAVVTKDQICEVVYPDIKNHAGITDHAIDQLIHRLREKIKGDYTLKTHRGLGYQLL